MLKDVLLLITLLIVSMLRLLRLMSARMPIAATQLFKTGLIMFIVWKQNGLQRQKMQPWNGSMGTLAQKSR